MYSLLVLRSKGVDSEEEKRALNGEINTLTDIILCTNNIKALISELKF